MEKNRKEIKHLSNSRLYIRVVIGVIMIMGMGIFTTPLQFRDGRVTIHAILVLAVSVSLVIYPKKESNNLKGIIIFLLAAYFYSLFFIYPKTVLNIIPIALIPGIAIVFFHKRIFYTIFSINILLSTTIFIYALFFDRTKEFHYLLPDFLGNLLDFYGSQVIIFFIFVMTNDRMEKLALYYEQIQKTERFKTTGQLAAAVAHEIRNPITVVKGFLQFYKEDNRIERDLKDHFLLMLEELDTAEKVINDFLSLAKPTVDTSVLCNIGEGVRNVVDLLHSYAYMNNISISVDVDDEIDIYCSKVEFNQLLVNLVKNAMEAMEHGGEIDISTEINGRQLELIIRDSGKGMDSDELKNLGSPFYSLKAKGTGLGLMICYNIIEKYGGSIQFASSKGEGTAVRLTFQIRKER